MWGEFPDSEKASREVQSMPIHPFLSDDEQDEIVQKLINLLKLGYMSSYSNITNGQFT